MCCRKAFLLTQLHYFYLDIHTSTPKKPWEKLSMDEMLKMVRDMRYQPSPSISLCTEDSTLETPEVMRWANLGVFAVFFSLRYFWSFIRNRLITFCHFSFQDIFV